MAIDYAPERDVELLTREEIDQAVAATVERSGFTVADLEHQAERGEFATERARLAWGFVADLRRASRR